MDVTTIEAAAAAARAFEPDVIIGLGGGSNMDLAKCVAVLLTHGGPLQKSLRRECHPRPVVGLIGIPTTSGTGSEVSPVAVVADPIRAMKVGIASRHIIPRWALVDPSLTLSCPPHVTAHSGMDALSHAIESFCAKVPNDRSPRAIFVGKNPLSDAHARQAIQLVARRCAGRSPIRATARLARDGARQPLCRVGVLVRRHGHGPCAAVPVGEETHTSHGLGNAVLMPAVSERLPRLDCQNWRSSRKPSTPHSAQRLTRPRHEQAPELIAELGESVQIARGLGAIGMKREKLTDMATLASGITRLLDDRPVASDREALLLILEEAY